MSYNNQPPTHSIEQLGGLEPYVNRFFRIRNLPYTFKDNVIPLFNVKGRTIASKAKEIDVVPSTFKNWESLYKATNKVVE
jgi:transposase-like protein